MWNGLVIYRDNREQRSRKLITYHSLTVQDKANNQNKKILQLYCMISLMTTEDLKQT